MNYREIRGKFAKKVPRGSPACGNRLGSIWPRRAVRVGAEGPVTREATASRCARVPKGSKAHWAMGCRGERHLLGSMGPGRAEVSPGRLHARQHGAGFQGRHTPLVAGPAAMTVVWEGSWGGAGTPRSKRDETADVSIGGPGLDAHRFAKGRRGCNGERASGFPLPRWCCHTAHILRAERGTSLTWALRNLWVSFEPGQPRSSSHTHRPTSSCAWPLEHKLLGKEVLPAIGLSFAVLTRGRTAVMQPDVIGWGGLKAIAGAILTAKIGS
jgi:hypothetical protein